LKALTAWILDRPRTVIAVWLIVLAASGYFATHLDGVIRGSTDGIPGSLSDQVMKAVNGSFGRDSAFVFPVVVESRDVSVRESRFAESIARLEAALTAAGNTRSVRHFWNSGAAELLGTDGRSALLLVTPKAGSFYEAEILVEKIRADLRKANLGNSFAVKLTGPVAVFHDMNRHSADDLLAAERIGIPITLVILLIVFGAPLAAGVPLLLAFTAVLMSFATLYAFSFWMPVSVFARNAVTMIGLGVGVDYALFLIGRYREELAGGHPPGAALLRAATAVGHTVLLSGMTVAAGFLVLFLVHVPLMHSLAIGGASVVVVAVAATLTLLPALLSLIGERIYWPFRPASGRERRRQFAKWWYEWAQLVMRRPWFALIPALAIVALFVAPVSRISAWNMGSKDLPPELEARQGAEILKKNFTTGWLGPVLLAIEPDGGGSLWDAPRQDAILAIAERLSRDQRIAGIGGFPAVLAGLGSMRGSVQALDELPPEAQSPAADAISRSGSMALIVLIPREAPESPEVMALVRQLRRDAWPEASAARLTVGVAGASAGIADFDQELFDSLWRVVPTVLLVTFLMLLVQFRSILIPLKATLLNLLSVLASWGFLVLVFQDGIGAGLIGLEPPGGLNAFIAIMLFTILFGLSMDYEVFLLSRIKEERDRGADNATAVARGLQNTAGIITSAALIMICIFGSFAFTKLTATREFGLGLAFAVALDATVIRIVLVPVLMNLFGDWNWWLPGALSGAMPKSRMAHDSERPL
jgi:RND superfamily putative drug exporter